MDLRSLLALLVLVAVSVASAQECVTLPSSGACSGYFRTGQSLYLTGVSVMTEAELVTTFAALDTNGFCTHCKENLKQFLCGVAYPDCTPGAPAPSRIAVPSEQSCSLAFGTCVPPDTPATIRSYIETAFTQLFQSADASVTDCPSLYTYIRSLSVGPISLSTALQYNNISTAFEFTPNCACAAPQGLTTCGTVVNYPVWSLVAAYQSTFDSAAATAITAFSAGVSAAGASCTDCTDQIKSSMCTAFFYRCASDRSRLMIPPCGNVCDNALSSCRIDQMNNAGVLSMIRNVSSAATAQLISDTVSNCTKEPFVPVVNAETTVQADGAATDFNIRKFSSNDSIVCHDGTYTPKPRCGCVSPDVVGTACEPYVTYNVWQPIKNAIRPQLDAFLAPLSQLDQLCSECSDAAKKALCQAVFPRCEADTVLKPVCAGDCEVQMSTCNVSAITALCSQISNNLPFKTQDFGSNCFTGGAAITPQCQICAPLTGSPTCAPYVTWPIFSVLSSQTSQIELLMSIVASAQLNYASCPECTTNMRKLYCSALFVPCSDSVLSRMANTVLGGGTLSFSNLGSLLPLVDQPCYDECNATTAGCLTTLTTNPSSILTCNSSSVSLFGQTVNFGGPIFSSAPTCYRHNFGTMPPSNCTVLRAPPGTASPQAAPVAAPLAAAPALAKAPAKVDNVSPAALVSVGAVGLMISLAFAMLV